jgi:transcriptional regulator with XRE-family HTH domain
MSKNVSEAVAFWSKVKNRIKELGITQKELGRRAGIPQSTLESQILRKTMPRYNQLIAISEALEMYPTHLAVKHEKTEKKVPIKNNTRFIHPPLYTGECPSKYRDAISNISASKTLELLLNKEKVEEDYHILQVLKISGLDNEEYIQKLTKEVLELRKNENK